MASMTLYCLLLSCVMACFTRPLPQQQAECCSCDCTDPAVYQSTNLVFMKMGSYIQTNFTNVDLENKCADEMNYCQNCSKADLLHSMRNYVLSLTEQDQSLDVLDILNELNEGTLQADCCDRNLLPELAVDSESNDSICVFSNLLNAVYHYLDLYPECDAPLDEAECNDGSGACTAPSYSGDESNTLENKMITLWDMTMETLTSATQVECGYTCLRDEEGIFYDFQVLQEYLNRNSSNQCERTAISDYLQDVTASLAEVVPLMKKKLQHQSCPCLEDCDVGCSATDVQDSRLTQLDNCDQADNCLVQQLHSLYYCALVNFVCQ